MLFHPFHMIKCNQIIRKVTKHSNFNFHSNESVFIQYIACEKGNTNIFSKLQQYDDSGMTKRQTPKTFLKQHFILIICFHDYQKLHNKRCLKIKLKLTVQSKCEQWFQIIIIIILFLFFFGGRHSDTQGQINKKKIILNTITTNKTLKA